MRSSPTQTKRSQYYCNKYTRVAMRLSCGRHRPGPCVAFVSCGYWMAVFWERWSNYHNNLPMEQRGRGGIGFVGAFSAVSSTTTTTTPPPQGLWSFLRANHDFGTKTFLTNEQTSMQQDNEDDDDDDDDSWMTARSCFGTKAYWDDVYTGRGDFPMEEYSWYYDWNVIQKYVVATLGQSFHKDSNILIPGIGNDPILYTLVQAGYRHLTAQDYSPAALERQQDLLADTVAAVVHWEEEEEDETIITTSSSSSTPQHNKEPPPPPPRVRLSCGNVLKPLPYPSESFDVILEKGLLDAIYLSSSDDTNDGGVVARAVHHLTQTLKPGGIFVSVSGVLPPAVRTQIFLVASSSSCSYECLRDGTNDLKAGCFIFRKKQKQKQQT